MGKEHEKDRALRRITGEEIVEETKRQAARAWGKVLPFGAQIVASAAAYSVGIAATQLVGFVFKVSCATPVLGPTMGFVGVGLANMLAGQASKHTRKAIVTRSHPLQPGFWEAPHPEDMVLDAVLGACIFKALGGRFSSLLPSDLSKPGALAFESIPARIDNSEAYAAPSVKRELARIFRRDGCHHCGSRRAPVIGDHMPPNKLLQGSNTTLAQWVDDIPVIGKVVQVLGGGRQRRPLQRFYPQCQRCSIKQAAAVRNGKRVLVLHLHWPRPGRSEHLAGVFVGLRYNAPDLSGPPGSDTRRRSGKWASLTLAAAPLEFRTELSGYSLQQLPAPPLASEPSSSSLSKGWGSSINTGTSHFLQVNPLVDAAAAPSGTTAWQQQQQDQQQLYATSHASSPHSYLQSPQGAFAPYGVQATGFKGPSDGSRPGGGPAGFKAGAGGGNSSGSLALMQQVAQRQRGGSGLGDEAARLPDQNPGGQSPAEAQGAALMAPERARARAEAAFERFAPGVAY